MRSVSWVVLSYPAFAWAQPPGLVPSEPSSADYLQVGVVAGTVVAHSTDTARWFAGGVTVTRAHGSGHAWFRGTITVAGLTDLNASTGTLIEGRAGAQISGCVRNGTVCGLASLDLGLRHGQVNATYDHLDSTTPVVIPQIALDIGTGELRLRPALELAFGQDLSGGSLSLGAAYLW